MDLRIYEHTYKFNNSWSGTLLGKIPLEKPYIPKTEEK
jgi:hypothetical protein